jgi:hypothetical protein
MMSALFARKASDADACQFSIHGAAAANAGAAQVARQAGDRTPEAHRLMTIGCGATTKIGEMIAKNSGLFPAT